MRARQAIPPHKVNLQRLTAGTGSRLEMINWLHFEAHHEWSAAEQAGGSSSRTLLWCSRCLPDPRGGFLAPSSANFLSPEALLTSAPLGHLWKFNPHLLSLFRTQPLGKEAQSCADCARSTALQAPIGSSVRTRGIFELNRPCEPVPCAARDLRGPLG
jgi:hypothetical protein